MTSKDKTVKIKAITNLYGVSEGKVYRADIIGDRYCFISDYGVPDLAHKSHFTVIHDEPAIEVGSEWVANGGKTVRIKYVGNTNLIYEDSKNTDEQSQLISFFTAAYKPKPKTVTMYFYKGSTGTIVAFDYAPSNSLFGPLLFTREIELP